MTWQPSLRRRSTRLPIHHAPQSQSIEVPYSTTYFCWPSRYDSIIASWTKHHTSCSVTSIHERYISARAFPHATIPLSFLFSKDKMIRYQRDCKIISANVLNCLFPHLSSVFSFPVALNETFCVKGLCCSYSYGYETSRQFELADMRIPI